MLTLVSAGMTFAQQYSYKRFTSADGLPSSTTTCTYHDSRGYLWVGTEAGLSRFDGISFRNYSVKDGLSGNLIKAILEDEDHRLWIATDAGIVIYDGYHFRPALPQGDTLLSKTILDLAITKGNIVWAGTSQGVNRIEDGQVTAFTMADGLLDDQVNCLAVNDRGEVLVGSTFGISAIGPDGVRTVFRSNDRQIIMSMLDLGENGLWFSTLIGNIYHLQGGVIKKMSLSGEDQYFGNFKLIPNSDGHIWLSLERSIAVFAEGRFQKRVDELPLPSDAILTTLYCDRNLGVWILSNAGLVRMKKVVGHKVPLRVNGQELPVNKVLVTASGKVLVGSEGDVYEYANGRFRPLMRGKPLQNGAISVLKEDGNGNIYVATLSSGLVRYDGRSYTTYRKGSGLKAGRVFSAHRDDEGRMLIGEQGGLAIFEGGKLTEYLHRPLGKVLSIAQGGTKYFLGTSAGLFSFDGRNFEKVPLSDTLSHVAVGALSYHGGSLWLGTEGMGIIQLEAAPPYRVLTTVDNVSGLGSDFVSSLQFDAKGQIWAGTNNGVYRVRMDTDGNVAQVRKYGRDDGVTDDTWNTVSMDTDSNGDIHVGASSGLISIRLSEYSEPSILPQVHLTGLSINQKRLDWRQLGSDTLIFAEHPLDLEFAHSDNSISFRYAGISLYSPEKLRYRHRLEGFDTDWSPVSNERQASYTNLPSGSYRFHVMASLGNGQWAKAESPVSISIEAPFWEKWWFIASLVILGLALVALIFRLRLRGIVRKQNEKIRVNKELTESRLMAFQAQMNPHFIFNALSSIQHFVVADENDQALLYLGKFSKQLRQILENSQKTYVTLEDELQMLEAYIEIESMRFKDRFSYEIQVLDGLDPSEIEIPALLIQPFVENAINHGLLPKGSKGHLGIRLGERDGQVMCIVEDDGIGRAASGEMKRKRRPNHQSFGMQIAKERLKLLNREQREKTHVRVEDIYGQDGQAQGTRVEISFPIKLNN